MSVVANLVLYEPQASPSNASGRSPEALAQIVGQERVVRQIEIARDAYLKQQASGWHDCSFGHTLLVGPPGLGKSMFAGVIAKEIGAKLHEELGQNLTKPADVWRLLFLAKEGDAILIDETHEMPAKTQTTLYRAIEDGKLLLAGKAWDLPQFTLFAATTDVQRLSRPLLERMKIRLELEYYSVAEVVELVKRRASALGWFIANTAVEGIAVRSRGTPRRAVSLLEAAHRHQLANGGTAITEEILEQMCLVEGVDQFGLGSKEREYLGVLRGAESPVQVSVLAMRVGMLRHAVERGLEPDLFRLGLITKTENGLRELTPFGFDHVNGSSCGNGGVQ